MLVRFFHFVLFLEEATLPCVPVLVRVCVCLLFIFFYFGEGIVLGYLRLRVIPV